MSHTFLKSLLWGSVASSCLISTPVFSAEELPTVVVSATRSEQSSINLPTSIKVITRKQIEMSGATTLSDVLRGQMGLHLIDAFGNGTSATVSMRGTGSASNVLIIIDGRRINNIDLNSPNLNAISIKDIERVELVQGSSGVLYGDQAVGGVINIITKRPDKFGVDVEIFSGSYDRNRIVARVENRLKNGLSYELTTDFLRADNYRENNKLDSTNVLGRVDYEFDTGSVFFELGRVKEVQELPGSLLAAEVIVNRRQSFSGFINDYSDTETEVTRLGSNISISDNWSIEAELTRTDIEKDVQNSFRTFQATSPSTVSSDQREFTPRLIGSIPVNGSEMLVTLGVDILSTGYSSKITFIDDSQKVTSYYGQVIYPVNNIFNVTVGGRHSKVENDVIATYKTGEVNDRATVFEAGLKLQLNSNITVFARMDENFRFAKVDELTYTPPGIELNNQSGKSKELGAELNFSALTAKIFLSRLTLEDEIAFDPSATMPVGASFAGANVNLDSTLHDSVVIDAKYKLAKTTDIMANFTYIDAFFISGSQQGNLISGVPSKLFTVSSSHRHSESLQGYAELIYTGDQFKSGDNSNSSDKLGSYSVVNLNAQYSWKEWTYSIRINNVLDNKYAEFVNSFGSIFPSPERNFWLSVAVSFR